MLNGSKPGNRKGGRKKGTPNRVTYEAREAFRAVYEGRLADLDRWIRETGDGYRAIHFLANGEKCYYTERNPGKAADLLLRMAEHFIPKLNHTTLTGENLGPITVLVDRND
jgi:hypothetical protein